MPILFCNRKSREKTDSINIIVYCFQCLVSQILYCSILFLVQSIEITRIMLSGSFSWSVYRLISKQNRDIYTYQLEICNCKVSSLPVPVDKHWNINGRSIHPSIHVIHLWSLTSLTLLVWTSLKLVCAANSKIFKNMIFTYQHNIIVAMC